MKKHFVIFLALFCLYAAPAKAEILQDIWTKYSTMSDKPDIDKAKYPGRIIGDLPQEYRAHFTQNWKMRKLSYELYFASAHELADAVFALAIFAKDVDADFPKDKFLRGVKGFHYHKDQVLAWVQSLYKKDLVAKDYPYLVQLMLEDGVLILTAEGFKFSDTIHHILAASAGKKRTFAATLEHERLHVFWDEDAELRERQIKKWRAFTDEQRNQIKKDLHQYAKDNEAQLIEEWSVHSTENSNFPLY